MIIEHATKNMVLKIRLQRQIPGPNMTRYYFGSCVGKRVKKAWGK